MLLCLIIGLNSLQNGSFLESYGSPSRLTVNVYFLSERAARQRTHHRVDVQGQHQEDACISIWESENYSDYERNRELVATKREDRHVEANLVHRLLRTKTEGLLWGFLRRVIASVYRATPVSVSTYTSASRRQCYSATHSRGYSACWQNEDLHFPLSLGPITVPKVERRPIHLMIGAEFSLRDVLFLYCSKIFLLRVSLVCTHQRRRGSIIELSLILKLVYKLRERGGYFRLPLWRSGNASHLYH